MSDNTTSLFGFSKRIYKLYSPYFGLKGALGWHSIYLGLILIGNVLASIAMGVMQTAFSAFTGMILESEITYGSFYQSCAHVSALMGTYSIIMASTDWLARTLGLTLAETIHRKITREWYDTGAYYGIKMEDSNGQTINPAHVLAHDVPKLSRYVITLMNYALMSAGNFVVGISGLITLSNTLTLSVGSFTLTIPGYMVIATLGYAYAYHGLTHTLGKNLKSRETELRNEQDKALNHLLHIHEHREEIAFKRGADFEKHEILTSLRSSLFVQKTLTTLGSLLMLSTSFQHNFSTIVALIIAAPNIIAKKIPRDSIFTLTNYFNLTLQLFTFKSENFENITYCEVYLSRIEKLQKKLDEWKGNRQSNQMTLRHQPNISDSILITDLTTRKDDGTPILENFHAQFPKGKTTHLQGASQSGKTGILRAMANIDSTATGTIEGLSKNTIFIPARPYFPHRKSLLTCLMYPDETAASAQQISHIHCLMDEMNLSHLKASLDKSSDWNKLSDGEKQRCMIINAILKKPECLLMDETTARVDHLKESNTKAKIEACLKKYLPGITIIYTDHNPSNDFADFVVDMPSTKYTKII